MIATGPISNDKQQSADSGWDNPFRPGGDLSREADEIVNMIKGGKSITPTENPYFINGITQKEEEMSKLDTTENYVHIQSLQNGTASGQVEPIDKALGNNENLTHTHTVKEVIAGPISACHVVIEEKNKNNGCCAIQ